MRVEHQKKAISGGISVGSSSILVIFVVLALTAFAALSLSTAGSDLRLTQRVARATQEYYAADAKGVEWAAELEKTLETSPAGTALLEAEKLGWMVNGMFASRSVEIQGEQTLEITADCSQRPIRFTRWQVVNSTDWEEQDSFSLWDGGADLNLASPTGLPPGLETGTPATPPPLPGFDSDELATIAVVGD